MSFREKITKNPAVAAAAAGIVIVICVILTMVNLRGASSVMPADKIVENKIFFSDDDGKTFYADDIKNVPPYTHDGKNAVRAILFKTESGTRFIAHLEQFKAEDKKQIDAAIAAGKSVAEATSKFTAVVKRSGDKTWVDPTKPNTGVAFTKATTPTPPKGATGMVMGPLRPEPEDIKTAP